ncbi:hypothetical protein LOK74_02050 [Brevibacillus humidisoli]|uniref:hypothetical protein n=1 Tax=Brevibacillus humidisoli TaxID=2895522 RepID=UPI001E3F0D8C|nr:hypothetical protein [Brevibacillus humidisoli]UFJ41343.1 hypothetical protein LOK74_02050 [Brevibacillus humidisoli]
MNYRVSLRLRSSDEQLAAWLDEHENKNEAILDALNQYLFGENHQPVYDQGPLVTRPVWATELQQMIQQLQDVVAQLERKVDAKTEQVVTSSIGLRGPNQQPVANGQGTEEQEPLFRDLAKGILNF